MDTPEGDLFSAGYGAGVNFGRYQDIKVKMSGENQTEKADSFSDMRLRQLLLRNVAKSGYQTPTPVQKYAIPAILAGRDLMACAQTGSGKSASFALPVLNAMLIEDQHRDGGPRALVLAPTRELARQIWDEFRKFSHLSGLISVCVYGGTSVGHQRDAVRRQSADVLIGTPGRILQFLEEGVFNLLNVKVKLKTFIKRFNYVHYQHLVLDEADRMLDQGFMGDITRFANHLP